MGHLSEYLGQWLQPRQSRFNPGTRLHVGMVLMLWMANPGWLAFRGQPGPFLQIRQRPANRTKLSAVCFVFGPPAEDAAGLLPLPWAVPLEAYFVDAETSENHPELTMGQRNYDVELAVERVYAELLDLQAGDLVPAGIDPLEVAEELQRRYDKLWDELTREEIIPVNGQRFRIAERLRRLNELGFAAEEVELVSTQCGNRLRVRTRVAEQGDHARKLFLRTGIEAGENQAGRLLNDIASFRAYLDQDMQGQSSPPICPDIPIRLERSY